MKMVPTGYSKVEKECEYGACWTKEGAGGGRKGERERQTDGGRERGRKNLWRGLARLGKEWCERGLGTSYTRMTIVI